MLVGDLRIVPNEELGKLITKGPKYIKSSTTFRDKAKSSIIYGMNGAVEELSNKFGHIDSQINKCKNKLQHQKFRPFLNNTSVKEALEKFQHNFAVATNDNAPNIVSFICKRFYATTILKKVIETSKIKHRIPKMHKSPIRTRFIIASKQCVIKPLSKNITAAFKLL